MDDLLIRFNELHQEMFDIILKLVPELKNALKNVKFPPNINSIGWPQYTSYDGSDFYAYCDTDSIFINGEDINVSEFNERISEHEYKKSPITGKYEKDINLSYDKVAGEFTSDFIDLINSFPQEVLKEAFGDHCLVTLKSDGSITTDSYEHD